MDFTAKTGAAAAFLAAVLLAGGCAGLNEAFAPGAFSGIMTPKTGENTLKEPASPPEAESYAAEKAYRTMSVPVRLNVPDRALNFLVGGVKSDLLGTPCTLASFAGGQIVEREFGKVLAANFREPVDGEAPVAELGVRVATVAISQKSSAAPMSAILKINIEVVKPDGSGAAYSDSIETSALAEWSNRSLIPDAFYRALSASIARFLDGWDRSGGPDAVVRWADDAAPGVVPPELHAIQWEPSTGKGGVMRGQCTIECNGWEGFRSKHWANAQIAVACRTKLGNIEQGRVRVVYDEEVYDDARGVWTFAFRCFARSEKVLEFDAATGCGSVIGDLGLMKMDPKEAAESLKAYVLEEMGSHGGIVTKGHPKTEAYVRFDNYRTDGTYGLITIDFHLPR